jgi:hypothetical protein
MFTRAGLDLRRARVILIYARMGIVGGTRYGWANLLRFRSGDLAWYCKRPAFLCWGLRAQFQNHNAFWSFGYQHRAEHPASPVDCPEAIEWRKTRAYPREELAA